MCGGINLDDENESLRWTYIGDPVDLAVVWLAERSEGQPQISERDTHQPA